MNSPTNKKRYLRLMRSMPVGKKMAVVVGAMLVPLLCLTGVYAWDKYESIHFTKQELIGVEYFHPMEEIGGAVNQRSANIAAELASGSTPEVASLDAEIDELVAGMDELDKKYGTPESSGRWQEIKTGWEELKGKSLSDEEESLSAHATLVNRMGELRTFISTEWGMALDPVAETYYALDVAVNQIPETQNLIGGLRAHMAAAANGAATSQGVRLELIRNAALAEEKLDLIDSELAIIRDKVKKNDLVMDNLTKIAGDWTHPMHKWLQEVEEVATSGATDAAIYKKLSENGKEVPELLDATHDHLMEATENLLIARDKGAVRNTLVSLLLVLLASAAAVKLAHAVSWRIIGSVRRLKDISAAIANGNFDNHIDKEANETDEMGQLYASVFTMQEQLRADHANRASYTREIRRMSGGLAATSASVMIADANHNIIYLNDAAKSMFRAIETDLKRDLPTFAVDGIIGRNIDVFHKNPSHQRGLLDGLTTAHKANFLAGGKNIHFVASPILGDAGERIGTVVEWMDQTDTIRSEQEIGRVVDAVLGGDLSQRISEEGKTGFHALIARQMNTLISSVGEVVEDVQQIVGEIGQGELSRRVNIEGKGGVAEKLGTSINTLVDTIGVVVHEVQSLVASANEGDLTKRIETSGKAGLLVKIGSGINELTENMAMVVSQVKQAAGEVSRGADEISQGNSNLSQRTEQQASSLEETASSMEEMTSTVKQNADNADQANQLAVAARDQAEKGGAVVAKAVRAMTEINDASKKISDIIGVIDEIAFQTNLLALNAAVEAARAGEQGRGFAVVASEVRNLAGRSATAAKEIKALIQDSVKKVDEGSSLVTQSGATLEQIVAAVKKVTDIVAEIAAASNEQSAGIDQVNKAVMQLDELTQQNAALVEQASAASQAMAEQARGLNTSMQRYQVRGAPKVHHAPVRSPRLRAAG